MVHVTENFLGRSLTKLSDGWWAVRVFVVTGLPGKLIPRRGKEHPECKALSVKGRWVDRKRSRKGLYFINVLYG